MSELYAVLLQILLHSATPRCSFCYLSGSSQLGQGEMKEFMMNALMPPVDAVAVEQHRQQRRSGSSKRQFGLQDRVRSKYELFR